MEHGNMPPAFSQQSLLLKSQVFLKNILSIRFDILGYKFSAAMSACFERSGIKNGCYDSCSKLRGHSVTLP